MQRHSPPSNIAPMHPSSSHQPLRGLQPITSAAAAAAAMYPIPSISVPSISPSGLSAPQQRSVLPPTSLPASTVSPGANAQPNLSMDYGLPKPPAAPGAYGRLPGVSAALGTGVVLTGRGNGLDYAVMRKEKAREEYKERRRMQLLANGDVERTKRRKKNDTSMSENQKYHRRLKMNQDSAAAARHAQEVYISTLENLVEVTESEKSVLSIQAINLKTERDDLMRRVHQLQNQLSSAQAIQPGGHDGDGDAGQKVAAQAQLDLKTVFELMDSPTHGAPTDFRNMNSAIHPPRAV